ncbi:MAG: TolC family protein [Verrucomicrobiota bacterium]
MRFVWLLLIALTVYADEPARPIKSVTLAECIERALQNNLDIRFVRINPQISQWGVVFEQGVYDPKIAGRLSYRDDTQLLDPTQAVALGLGTLENQTLTAGIDLLGKLPSGATYDFGVNDQRSSGTLNSQFVYTGGWLISATQPLLKNAWFGVNSASIRIARKNQQIAKDDFARQVMDTISAVQNAYYELNFARANYQAKLEDLNSAKALLAENRKRVEVGVLSPLDVTQAEAGAAEREEAVVIADSVIQDTQLTLTRLITHDVSEFSGLELLPADTTTFEMVELDVARSTRTALDQRPEYANAKAACDKQNITVQFSRNQLWPQVDLFGSYGYNARSPMTTNASSSFNEYLGNLTEGQAPVWSIGVAVSIPLGSRQERSTYRIARMQADQTVINLKRIEQSIVAEVDTAVRRVHTNLKRIDATKVASRLADESLKAEQQKLRAGTSTSFLVLQAQAQLATARSAAIRARADYDESLVALARVEGNTLKKHKITLDENPKPSQ